MVGSIEKSDPESNTIFTLEELNKHMGIVSHRVPANLLHQTVWINVSLVDMIAVEDIASETRDFLALVHFSRTRSWLGVLASHAADADNAFVGPPDEHYAHLQEQLDLGLDGPPLAVIEELGAVATLE